MKKILLLIVFIFTFFCYGDTVSGIITKSDGKPVAGAKISIFNTRTKTLVNSAFSDKNGRFIFENLQPDYYRIVVSKTGYCEGNSGRIEINNEKFGVQKVQIILMKPGSISGFVYGIDSNPISGAEVILGTKKARTNEKGFYKIEGLNPEFHHVVSVYAPGFVKEWKGSVEVKEGKETAGIDFILSFAGRVKGIVVDSESGKPVRGVQVSCSGPVFVSGLTDVNGGFFLDNLKEGFYTLHFYRQGYEYFQLTFNIIPKQLFDCGTVKLKLRDRYFYPVSREWIFTPEEKIRFYFNAYRIPSVSIDIYRIDVFDEINRSRMKNISIREIFNSFNPAGKDVIFTKKFEIKYPSPLSELYDRQILIDPLPEGAYLCVIKPESLPEYRQHFVVSNIGFISKSDSGKKDYTLFSISKGKIINHATLYIFDHLWILKEQMNIENGQFSLSDQHRFIITDGKSFAFSDTSYTGDDYYRVPNSIYAYTDRPVYRPGQTVHFKALARIDNGSYYSIPEFTDCVVKISSPDETLLYETVIKPEKFSSICGQWNVPDEPPLGAYSITFSTRGKHELKGSCNFKVLEYRKPEFSIEIKPDKEIYLAGEKIKAHISAKYYFGAPVRNADVMWAVYSKEAYYYDYEEDYYEYDGWWRGTLVTSGNSKTDESGYAFIEIPLKKSYQRKEFYTIEVRMTDLSRREIKASSQVVVLPGCFEILVSTDRYVYSDKDEINLKISTKYYLDYVPPARQSLNISMKQQVYDSKKKRWIFNEIMTKNIVFSGTETTLKLKPVKSGYIEASAKGIDQFNNIITGKIYIWVTGEKGYNWWYGSKEIEIIPDKKEYKVGEKAKILINSSHRDLDFIFTIEGTKLFEKKIIKMEGNSTLIEIPVKEEYIPNFYVSVCSAKNKNFIHAIRSLSVERSQRLLKIEISPSKKEFKPGENADYKIKITDFQGKPVVAEFSMGVVDESIYAISGELVPSIEDFFYGRKPNRVSTSYSFYRWHYAGAGKDFAEEDIRRKFKDTAYWLSTGFTDENGIANIMFELPDNLTTWRTTLRSSTIDTKVGTGIDRIITTKSLIANLITPRFLVEDDRVLISAVIHNRTATKQDVIAALKADTPEILDSAEKSISISPGSSARIDWKIKVNPAKNAKFTLFAESRQHRDAMELVLPVLAWGSEERYVFAGRCDDIKTDTFFISQGTISPSIDAKTYIYPSLVSSFFSSLDELAKYPYGCVEQTLNAFLPAIQIANTLSELKREDLYFLASDKSRFEEMLKNLPEKVSDGLIKLYNYQNEDGGWGWWRFDSSNPYTSGYVVFGLVHAKKSGYLVNEERLEKGKNFLKTKISTITDFDQKAFMLYVLNYAGEKNPDVMEELYKNREKLNPYTLAQLCLVMHNAKDNRAKELLEYLCSKSYKPSPSLCFWQAENGNYGWINHNIEATAWGLRAIIAIDPSRQEIPAILRYLVKKRQGGFWHSTKDTAICLFAFTELLETSDELSPDYIASIFINDNQLAREKIDRKTIERFSTTIEIPAENFIKGKTNTISIEKSGKGNLYYNHVIKFAVKDISIPSSSHGFDVSRRYTEINPVEKLDEKGNRVFEFQDINRAVKSGERVRVELRIKGGEKYEYIMIEDPIPAGFEVIDEPWDEYYWYCRKKIRDQKVAFFTPLWEGKEKIIVYHLRAETPGFYHILPTKAQLMYLPEIWGRSGGNVLTVE